MQQALICDAVRTPFGRYGGALSALRADDLAALPLKALLARLPQLDPRPLMTLFWGAPTRPVKTTATWREWRCCWPDCRTPCRAPPSIACAVRDWTR
ncbi:hypothetical protein M5585_12630 [Serratia ureilytica]